MSSKSKSESSESPTLIKKLPNLECDPLPWWKTILVTSVSGSLFGIALFKSQMYNPNVIVEQFSLESMTMLQTFLYGEAFSLLAMSSLDIVTPENFVRIRHNKVFDSTTGKLGPFLGGILVGIGGFAIGGTCPGTIFPQIGAGVHDIAYLLAGALSGVVAFSTVASHFVPIQKAMPIKYKSVDTYLGVNYLTVALPFAAVSAGIATWLGTFGLLGSAVPYGNPFNLSSFIRDPWHPAISGLAIGLAQFFSTYILEKPLGCSTSFPTALASLTHILPDSVADHSKLETIRKYATPDPNTHWQLLQSLSMTASTYGVANYLGLFGKTALHVSPAIAFAGGFLLLIGARLAQGCTSGHGLSGMSVLRTTSVLATAGMFVGGFTGKALLNALGFY